MSAASTAEFNAMARRSISSGAGARRRLHVQAPVEQFDVFVVLAEREEVLFRPRSGWYSIAAS